MLFLYKYSKVKTYYYANSSRYHTSFMKLCYIINELFYIGKL